VGIVKPLFWIAGVPLLFCGAVFAIANRAPVSLDLWPIADRIELPLFVALTGALYSGFGLGAAIAWWAARHSRRAGRDATRRVGQLEAELQKLRGNAGPGVAERAGPAAVAVRP
jgi:uncharacterized integral membrane protein